MQARALGDAIDVDRRSGLRPFMVVSTALALGGIVLSVLDPTDLGFVGGSSVAAALLVLVLRERRERLKLIKIAG